MNNQDTGKFIAERRKALGLSQKQLAEELHLTDKAVSK
ncbi:MAG: multiprotein-bridging factor 1 family protein [Candidatus Fimenecus sp.]